MSTPSGRRFFSRLLPLLLAASSPGTARALDHTLTSGPNPTDGFAAFTTDETGAIHGCAPGFGDPDVPGIRFDPLGPLPQINVNCGTTLYVFDQAGTIAAALDATYPPSPAQTVTILSDTGTTLVNKRISRFTHPSFGPNLPIELTQYACANTLYQRYVFYNQGSTTLNLRITRVGDLDIAHEDTCTPGTGPSWDPGNPFSNAYLCNTGSGPMPGVVPANGCRVMDGSLNQWITFTAGGDAAFERWMVTYGPAYGPAPGVVGDFGAGWLAHVKVFNSFGIPLSYQSGVYNITWGGSAFSGADVFDTDTGISAFRSDAAAITQSTLTIPPGTYRTYIAETICEPGIAPTAACCGNTPVNPTSPVTISASAPNGVVCTVTFPPGSITCCGETTLNYLGAANCSPSQVHGFSILNRSGCWDIQTTACVTFPVTVCFTLPSWANGADTGQATLNIRHYTTDSNGNLLQANLTGVTRNLDPDGNGNNLGDGAIICGQTPSFSRFVIDVDRFMATDFEQPMGNTRKLGSTLPIKIKSLFFTDDAGGTTEVTSQAQLDQLLAGMGLPPACPAVRIYDETAHSALPLDDLEEPGAPDNPGDCMRRSGGSWIFNLKLDSSFLANHTYRVELAIGDFKVVPGNHFFTTRN